MCISLQIMQGIYGNIMCNIWDLNYTETLIKHILTEVLTNTTDQFPIGNTTLSVPPANVGK